MICVKSLLSFERLFYGMTFILDTFSKFGRKRSRGGTRSPPLRSPEPMAKRACLSPGMGGVSPSPTKQIRMSSNGHASSNGNGHSSTPSPPTSRREPSRFAH